MEAPKALDAETWLLGGVLQDPKALGELSLLLKNGGEFFMGKNQAVWNAMISLYKEDNPIDIITLANALERDGKLSQVGGKEYLFSLMESVTNAAHIDYYAKIIRDKYILRSLISSSNENIRDSSKPEAEVEDVLKSAQKRILDLTNDQIKENIQPAGDIAKIVLDKLVNRKAGDLSGCPTNFKDLDALTNGLQKTDLIILAGRPGMGKTAFALNVATNAARCGKTVLFFTLEMSAEQIITRILSSMANVNQKQLKHGQNIISTETAKNLIVTSQTLATMPLFIDDSSEARAFDLLSKCRIFKRKHGSLDLVVVDYLQLMLKDGRAESEAVGIGENSRMLKVLAKELDVPVLVLSQLNRETEKRSATTTGNKPQLSDLRGSGSIEQDADMVWFIHRPAYYNKEKEDDGFQASEEEKEKNEAEKRKASLIIAKYRNGPTTNIDLEFIGEITTFKDRRFTPISHPDDIGFSDNFGS
jgi:replicative DNA helicase